jgi:hypothetical protein
LQALVQSLLKVQSVLITSSVSSLHFIAAAYFAKKICWFGFEEGKDIKGPGVTLCRVQGFTKEDHSSTFQGFKDSATRVQK